MALNPRQLKFVQGYLSGKSAKQAYLDAGYELASRETAETAASRLLRNVQVKAAVESARREAAIRAELSAEWVLTNLKGEALERGDGASHSARVRALELLGRQFGMFKDALEMSGPNGSPLAFRVVEELADAQGGGDDPVQADGGPTGVPGG